MSWTRCIIQMHHLHTKSVSEDIGKTLSKLSLHNLYYVEYKDIWNAFVKTYFTGVSGNLSTLIYLVPSANCRQMIVCVMLWFFMNFHTCSNNRTVATVTILRTHERVVHLLVDNWLYLHIHTTFALLRRKTRPERGVGTTLPVIVLIVWWLINV